MAAIACFSAANFSGTAVLLPPMFNITDVAAWSSPCTFKSWRVPAGLAVITFPGPNFGGIPFRVDSTSPSPPYPAFTVMSFAVIDRADQAHILVDTGDTTFAPVVVPVGTRLPVIFGDMDMSVSSLHVPPGAILVGYKRRYFLGPYRVYNGTSVTLNAWNNRIRSVMVLPATSPLPPQPLASPSSTANNASAFVRFFAKPNYDVMSLEESVPEGGVPSMEDWPFDLLDIMPRSITLDPGVVFIQYSETNFQGARRIWSSSNPNMPQDSADFVMRSFKVANTSMTESIADQTDYAVCAASAPSSKLNLYIQVGDAIPDLGIFAVAGGCAPLTLPPSTTATYYSDANYTGTTTTFNSTTTAITQLKGSLILNATAAAAAAPGLSSVQTMWIAFGALVGAALATYFVFRKTTPPGSKDATDVSAPPRANRTSALSPPPLSKAPQFVAFDASMLDWGDLALVRLDSRQVSRCQFLASGASGEIYSGVFQTTTPVALKQLHVYTANSVQRFIREINLLASIESPHIVRLIGAVWTSPSDLQAVFELMGGGDLHSYLRKTQREQVTWPTRLAWAKSVVEGLFYLHSMQHMHRDLKSRNLLLSADASMLKVADFGTARDVDDGTHTANVGTYRWMAPEILAFQPYTNAVDVYSFGVVMAEIETHQTPYAEHLTSSTKQSFHDETHIIRRVLHDNLRPTFSPACPVWYKYLALRCMAGSPADRPSTSEILHVLITQQRRLDEGGDDGDDDE